MNEAVVSTDELQILLNLVDEISVMYPLYRHFSLLSAEHEEEGYRLKIMQGDVDFDDQKLHEELPSYSDFCNASLQQG